MKKKWILLLLITISFTSLTAQDALYPNTFPLRDVRITAGPFKHACDLNVKVLLQYDTDRLLAPFLREAGLPKKAETYGNWEKDGLDGHIGGHYLTALAIHYAATGNLECKKRMDYMVSDINFEMEVKSSFSEDDNKTSESASSGSGSFETKLG